MKVETSKTPTVTHGMEKSRAFHFEFNRTMFKTLSSTTYSDPIRAVIRELACNSADAHVMAGNTSKKFEIHLPTSHEPEFSIRDYGTGMNDQEINDLFTMYGGSNKRESNDVIGALGIGSKSPYSYTDMYTVVATKDGVTRTYVAHVEDGMPRLSPSGETATPNASNGVIVKFAVKERDIWEFENKAKVALEFFDGLCKVNVPGFVAHKQSYILKTDRWGLRRDANTAHGYHVRAIMGKVQYQVGSIDESRTNSLQKKILAMPIDMFFNLGDLQFQASRESLVTSGADGEKTLVAILKMCDQIVEESIQTVRAKIDACKDVWEAQLLLFSLLNQSNNSVSGNSMSDLIREALQKGKLYGKYANFDLSESKAIINMLAYSHIHITKFEKNERRYNAKRCKKEPFILTDQKSLRDDKKLAKSGDPLALARHRHEVTVKPNVLFVINDTKFPGDKYIHFYVHESGEAKGKDEVYMIHRPKSAEVELAQVVKNAKKLIADMGNPPVRMLSEFVTAYAPIFASRRPTGQSRKTRQIAVLKNEIESTRRRTTNGWMKAWRSPEDAEIVPGSKKFYVVIDKKLVGTETGFEKSWDFLEFVEYVRASGKFGLSRTTPVYGVKANHKALKENDGEWVELMSHVYQRVNEIMTPQKIQALSLYLTPFSDDCHELLNYLASKQPLSNSPAQMFACALADAKAVKFDNWSSFQWVLNFCQRRGKYSQTAKTIDFNEKWQQIKAGYPMLQFVGSYHHRSHMKTLVQYLSQVDEQNFRETAAKAAASNQ